MESQNFEDFVLKNSQGKENECCPCITTQRWLKAWAQESDGLMVKEAKRPTRQPWALGQILDLLFVLGSSSPNGDDTCLTELPGTQCDDAIMPAGRFSKVLSKML